MQRLLDLKGLSYFFSRKIKPHFAESIRVHSTDLTSQVTNLDSANSLVSCNLSTHSGLAFFSATFTKMSLCTNGDNWIIKLPNTVIPKNSIAALSICTVGGYTQYPVYAFVHYVEERPGSWLTPLVNRIRIVTYGNADACAIHNYTFIISGCWAIT